MNYTMTKNDKDTAFSKWQDIVLRIMVLNDDDTVLEEISGIIDFGSLTIDVSSSVRRTYGFCVYPFASSTSMQDKLISWMNRECLVQIGCKTPRMKDYKYYNQGRFKVTNTSFTYDAQNNSLNINCSDLYITLNGSENGIVSAQSTVFPAYEEDKDGNPTKYNTIKDVLITILTQLGNVKRYIVNETGAYKGFKEHNINYMRYRTENPRWNCIPYDLEYSCGSNVGEMLEEIVNLYPGNDAAFNENGTFVVQAVPSCLSDPVIINDDDINSAFISENTSCDLSKIRNICEVWGKTFETDYYSDHCVTDNGTYAVTIEGYDEDYYTGDIVSIKVDTTNTKGQSLNINNLGAVFIYDENTDKPIEAGLCTEGEVYTFKCKKIYDAENNAYVSKFYLLGQWQPHGLNVLSDGTVIKNGYTSPDGKVYDKYSKEYFQNVYNCDNVEFMVIKDSPFTVQKIGERPDVKNGGEYDNISSSSLALSRAEYENWKNCRLTDEITITLNTLIPWLKENMKISYTPKDKTTPSQYITKSITLNFGEGTTTINMYTFYPLYEETGYSGTHKLLSEYTHDVLSDFTHAELRKAEQ